MSRVIIVHSFSCRSCGRTGMRIVGVQPAGLIVMLLALAVLASWLVFHGRLTSWAP